MPHLAALKICRLVVGKEASALSTLHGIVNCVKNWTTRKILSFNRCHNYFHSSLRNLFTAFLETKTQLWKLMWAILRCYIGSSGSSLHLPRDLNEITKTSEWLLPCHKVFCVNGYPSVDKTREVFRSSYRRCSIEKGIFKN